MTFNGLVGQARQIWGVSREQGLRYALWAASTRLAQVLETPAPLTNPDLGYDELFRRYRADALPATSVQAENCATKRSLNITWLAPLGAPGSGGLADIVHFAAALSRQGHENTLCFVSDQPRQPDLSRVAPGFTQSYGGNNVKLMLLKRPIDPSAIPPSDVVIATLWQTAYILNAVPFNAVKAYFVQDYEPWFQPRGSEALLADQSYHMDFQYITLGRWLKQEVHARCGKTAFVVDFPVDTSVFYPRTVPKRSPKFRVACYVRTTTPRRSFELAIFALRSFVEQAGDDVEVVLFGDPFMPHRAEFTNVGSLSRDDLAGLYSSVDVVVSLSATNMSLIPREAAACGAAVVELNLPPVRAHLTHGRDAYLTEPLPSAICDALLHLYRDRDLCRAIAQEGQKAAHALPSWDDVARAIEPIFQGRVSPQAGRSSALNGKES